MLNIGGYWGQPVWIITSVASTSSGHEFWIGLAVIAITYGLTSLYLWMSWFTRSAPN